MITLKNISISFKNKPLFKDLSCEINKGDFIVIVGANGAGKSTLFDLITGKKAPDSGALTLHGKDITNMSEASRASFIGRLFQRTNMNSVSSMTVAQNLALASYKNKRTGFNAGLSQFPQQFLDQLTHEFGIDFSGMLDVPMASLSGGQRQLVSFVMAICTEPELLLLDEPTAALDPQAATKLLQVVNTFVKKRGITTILITHDPQLALVLGNKLWILEDGIIKHKFNVLEKRHANLELIIGQIDYEKL